MENSGLTVKIFDLKTGLVKHDNVDYVRITSKDYNLLIMLDYLPIIGEVEGKIDIKVDGDEIHYENVKASYMNSKNVFNIMILGDFNE